MNDSPNELLTYINGKFGENGDLVNKNTRYLCDRGATKSQINCSIGYNPHWERENIIDENKPAGYPRCGEKETWINIVIYPLLRIENENFMRNMSLEIEKIEVNKQILKCAMIEDIESMIKNREECKTMQQVIGIEIIF